MWHYSRNQEAAIQLAGHPSSRGDPLKGHMDPLQEDTIFLGATVARGLHVPEDGALQPRLMHRSSLNSARGSNANTSGLISLLKLDSHGFGIGSDLCHFCSRIPL